MVEYYDNLYHFNDTFKINLNKFNDLNYSFISYSVDSNDKNIIHKIDELYFKDIIKLSINVTDSTNYEVYFKYLSNDNKIKNYGQYSYQYKNLSEANCFLNLLCKLLYNKNIIENIENVEKSNIELNINYKHINYMELNDLSLLTNSFITQDNIWVSKTFDKSNELNYYYDLKFTKLGEKNLLVIFKFEEGHHSQFILLFFDNIILLKNNFNEWFPNRYNLNMKVINGTAQINFSFDRLIIEDFEKLYYWIDDKIKLI
jgi:hypothetical protein